MNTGLKNKPKFQWSIVLGSVILVYLVINLALPHLFSGFNRVYVVQPILWCLLIGGVLLASRYGAGGKLRFNRALLWIGLLVGAFQLACLVIAGLFASFGNSPYSHTPYYIFLNIVLFGSGLVGIEFSRAYLLSAFGKRYTVLMMAFIALLFATLMIPTTRLTHSGEVFPFFGGTGLPLVAENLLACFLAVLGGPVAAIAYRGMLEAFEFFSPILPDLTWMVVAFVGTLAPVIGFLVVQSLYGEPEPEEAKQKPKKRSSLVGWVVTAIVAVILIFVTFGALGFSPVAIVSGSMSPAIDVGDLVVVRDASADDINVGDVIQYQRGNTETIHRVIEIQQQGASTVFITKGDANDTPDLQPVHPDQIKGKVRFVMPKVGWVSIKLKQLFS